MKTKKNPFGMFLVLVLVVTSFGLVQGCNNYSQKPAKRNPEFKPDVEIDITAQPDKVNILPGKATEVYTYKSKLIKGDKNSLQKIEGSYLGPIINVKKGEKIRVNFRNKLNEESIIHWHGLHLPEKMDGHPRFVIDEGQKYIYEFTVMNRAGTYWFHPHPHGSTGPQVYAGLAGLFIVHDKEEEALNLPKDQYDVPLVIQDRTFNSDNELVYLVSPMEKMTGFLGDRILVNGKPDFKMPVESRAYRLRLLNGSNSRIYKIAFSNGQPLTVIGNDGGLLEKPITKKYITLAPAERVELIVDFSGLPLGDKVDLVSLYFPGTSMGGGMMGRRSAGLPNGTPFKIAEFSVNKIVNVPFTLPDKLSEIPKIDMSKAINKNNPRKFVFAMSHMSWTINGRTFGMTEVAPDEKVKLNTTEVWEFLNGGMRGGMMGGMMMQMPHPVHIHQLQFRIISRTPGTNSALWNSLKEGFVDEGWKDTFLLLPGMKVKLLLSFEDFPGLFLYHCHNLEHEDMGMMRNFLIEP